MKILKFNETINNEEKPQKGEFIIYEFRNKNYAVEITSNTFISRNPSSVYTYTKNILNNNESDIYYNLKDKFFFYAIGDVCEIKWRGFNKENAIEAFEVLNTVDKYNL